MLGTTNQIGKGKPNKLSITCERYIFGISILFEPVNQFKSFRKFSQMGWLSKPTTFNILQLGFAFLFNFIAFNGAGNSNSDKIDLLWMNLAYIEQAVVNSQSDAGNISKHAGYYR